jgi:uncharacterized membrane protein YbhN (UPF0104 family)
MRRISGSTARPNVPATQPSGKRRLWTACKVLFGFTLLGWVLWRNWDPPGGIGLSGALSGSVGAIPLLLATGCFLVSPVCAFIRWYFLVRAQGLGFTLRDAFRLGSIGLFWNTALPGGVGGDLVKASLLLREQSRRTAAVATVLVDRLLGLVGLFFLVSCVGSACWLCHVEALQRHAMFRSVVVVALGLTAGAVLAGLLPGLLPDRSGKQMGVWLSGLPWIGSVAAELWEALWLYRARRMCVVGAVLLSALGHVGSLLTFYYAAQVFHKSSAETDIPSLAEHLLIIPAGMLFQALFPSPGGVGGGEYGFGQLYAMLGKPEAQGVLGSLAVRAITWGVCLCGGLVYLVARSVRRQSGNPGREEELRRAA